jgi:chromosome segregation ATPase
MTELETHLTNALKRLEQQCHQRDQQLANTLADLSKRLNDGAGRTTILNSQLAELARRIERLQTALNQR